MRNKWQYTGDVNVEYGGIFYQDSGELDHCYAVKIVPVSDGGGPNNVFAIETGSYYFGNMANESDRKRMYSALECSGYECDVIADLPLIDKVHAMDAYGGIDGPEITYISDGKLEDNGNYYPWQDKAENPDKVLRATASLR